MKKISLFNATSRRQTRSGDRSDNKPETRRAVSNPESNDTLRKLVDVKHEVPNRTKYFIKYKHYILNISSDQLNPYFDLPYLWKATRQWEEEQDEFNRRKLKYNKHLAEIEQQEILRREDALSRINHNLDEMRRKHKTLETVFENQVSW